MALSKESSRLFSVSDDGHMVVSDLNSNKIVNEYMSLTNKYP